MAPTPHRVVTIAPPGATLFELGTPSRLFGAARTQDGQRLYQVGVVAADGSRRVRIPHGGELVLPAGLDDLGTADTIVVTSSEELLDPGLRSDLADILRPHLTRAKTGQPQARVASICTGAFLLGALGLLDGRRATTHWRLADQLSREYPATRLTPADLYVEDPPVLTSAGVAAGIDMCLHMIRTDHGVHVANTVARTCIVSPLREGGQSQYVYETTPASATGTTAAAVAWALDHLDEEQSIAAMATRANMSTRTFERRFRSEHGTPPGRWLTQARIQRAKELLETTDLPIETIAHRVGLGSSTNLRAHFHRCTSTTPHAYRRTFQTLPNGTVASTGAGMVNR